LLEAFGPAHRAMKRIASYRVRRLDHLATLRVHAGPARFRDRIICASLILDGMEASARHAGPTPEPRPRRARRVASWIVWSVRSDGCQFGDDRLVSKEQT
jgi:hypothetical protein